MKRTYQRPIAYLLLLLTASPVLFGIFLLASRIIVQHRMREEIEKRNLITITTDLNQVKWTDEGKEAFVHGNLFDVEHYSVSGDKIQLTGLFDKKEDEIIAQIEHEEKNKQDNSDNSSLVFQLLGCFSLCTTENDQFNFYSFVSKQNYSSFPNPVIISTDMPADTPPPKSLSAIS